jgi:hypothetical protein
MIPLPKIQANFDGTDAFISKKQVTAHLTAINSCQVPLIKKEVIVDHTGPAIHRGRDGFENRRRGRRGAPSSRGWGSGVYTQVQAGSFNFSIIKYTELISVIWNPAVENMESLESESQLIVSHDFKNESVSSPLQETEVYSPKTILMEHRERSGTGVGCWTRKPGHAAINSQERSNSNRSSGGVRSHMKEGSLHFPIT